MRYGLQKRGRDWQLLRWTDEHQNPKNPSETVPAGWEALQSYHPTLQWATKRLLEIAIRDSLPIQQQLEHREILDAIERAQAAVLRAEFLSAAEATEAGGARKVATATEDAETIRSRFTDAERREVADASDPVQTYNRIASKYLIALGIRDKPLTRFKRKGKEKEMTPKDAAIARVS